MKVEMGESLFYSWLRHYKRCQVVQTNWKPSRSWDLHNEKKLSEFMDASGAFFVEKRGYSIFGTTSFRQVLNQAEVDALGISISDGTIATYAVDVAFHEYGMNYGDRKKTAEKVIQKLLRASICVSGYLGSDEGEIIFASPKISKSVVADLRPCVDDINELFTRNSLRFTARLIANDDFDMQVLRPILAASKGIADTSELFMRAYQLIKMFE